jgi:two-component system KDP operon response regulator KdpE
MQDADSRPTVLVLDDEPLVRRTMQRFLAVYGYSAVEAESFEQALEILRTTKVFAVILDVRLPGPHTGLDVLGPLRERSEFADIPVLVMTGGVVDEQEERLIARHRAHLFFKPEGFNALLSFLDQLTGRDRLV